MYFSACQWASIKAPPVWDYIHLGTVVCETNFLTDIIKFVMLNGRKNSKIVDKDHYLYFYSGLYGKSI